MPEKNTNLKMASSSKCSCCPYGFHIDRDFVRFCDTLYNTGQLDKLRQHKRERRKEKKSVESYLGIGIPSSFEENRNYNDNKKISTLPHDFYLHNDGLNDAVNDFEDTWQKSLKKSSSSNDVAIKQKQIKTQCNKINEYIFEENKNKGGSCNLFKPDITSSSLDSSQSTTLNYISTINGSTTSEALTSISYAQIDGSSGNTTKSDINSVMLGSKIHKSMLTTIREQMASSLTRLKELEEQVKCIPELQVQLSTLTEEKKHLLNQLKFNQNGMLNSKKVSKENNLEIQLKRLENEGIMSPTITRKCLLTSENGNNLSSPSMASNLESVISKKVFIENKIISNVKISDQDNNESKKILKNVGTSCSVLTRDIGIGYVPNKLKSIAVECDTLPNSNLSSYKNKHLDKYTDASSESLESDLESYVGSEEQLKSSLSISKSYSKTLPTKKYYRNFTDSCTSMNFSFAHKSTNTDTVSNVNNSFQKISTKPLTRSKFVQVSDHKSFFNRSTQTVSNLKDSKMNSEIAPKFDAAVGDFDINQIICSNCQKTKKSVGSGDFSVKITSCEKCTILPLTKSSVSKTTKTVGVGDFDITEFCQNDFNEIPTNKEKISIGINTIEVIPNPNLTTSDIHICDKCSAAIHSVARGLAANISDSKIPKINVKSPVNKSNHMKLPKLKIPVYQSPKTDEKIDTNLIKSQVNSNSSKKHSDDSYHEEVKEESNLSNQIQAEIQEKPEQSPIIDMTCVERKKSEISKEIKAACKVLNDCLQKSNKGTEKKALSSLNIIQNEWFKVANQKNADPLLIEDYLDVFEEFSKLLLQRVVNLSDNNGNTALHYGVSYGNFDVVSILIDSKVCDVNKKNKAGYTSIMLVALADIKNDAHQYVVQRLFNIGDINIKASQNGQTALMLAVSHGKKDIAKILLDSGAEVNLQDKDGSTALMCAAEHGHLEIVKFLLSHPECDPTIMDNDNCTALTIAMEAGHKDIGLLIYTNLNFSRGSSPSRKRSTPRSTPPPRTPTLRTPPLPSPSARSTNSIPASFHFSTY